MVELPPSFYVASGDPLGSAIAAAVATPTPEARTVVERIRGLPLSMLAEPTLRAMHAIAATTNGVILEIGAYVGGATIVLLDGAAQGGTDVVTLEEPVSHEHPEIPTKNSVEDLRRNVQLLSSHAERHFLIPGCSFETDVLGRLHHALLGREISFLAWDADSLFERDLALLAPFLAGGCVIMIDDYFSAESKSDRLSKTVDALIEDGILEPVALLPWATWFGRLKRKPDAQTIRAWLTAWEQAGANGDPYCRRLTSYRERVVASEQELAISFAERRDFWRIASSWKKPQSSAE